MIFLYKFGTNSVSRNGTNFVGSPFEKRAIYVKYIGITHPKGSATSNASADSGGTGHPMHRYRRTVQ